MDMDVDGLKNKGIEVDVIPLSKVKVKLDHIISQSYPEVIKLLPMLHGNWPQTLCVNWSSSHHIAQVRRL